MFVYAAPGSVCTHSFADTALPSSSNPALKACILFVSAERRIRFSLSVGGATWAMRAVPGFALRCVVFGGREGAR
jgi:hypothetical protein